MPSNALIFTVLVSGFLALRLFSHTRYLSQAWDTTRVVLWSGVAGGVFFGLARGVCVVLRDCTSFGHSIQKFFGWVFPIPFAATLVATGIAATTTAVVLNQVVRRVPRLEKWFYSLTRYQVHSLHAFLSEEWDSQERDLVFTLDDSKIYVATVFAEPPKTPREAYVEILPSKSGYRDSETREITITRDYDRLLDRIERIYGEDEERAQEKLRLLRVVVPFTRIVSVHGWDEGVTTVSRPPEEITFSRVVKKLFSGLRARFKTTR